MALFHNRRRVRLLMRDAFMGRRCVYPWCKDSGIFHSFPRDADRAKLWLQAIGWPSNTDSSKMYLCSKHFSPQSYENWKMVEFGIAQASSLRLSKDAVPIREDFHITSKKPVTKEVGCQCDAPIMKSVGVQADYVPKRPKRRSKAIQVRPSASVSCSDEEFPVKSEASSTLTPIKRPRVEDSSDGSSCCSEDPPDDTQVPDIIPEEDIKLEPCDSSYIVVTL
nr:uncharacterized protein LOC563780 isoform X4 [Danio rerio]XP_021335464.1 uncharacterized protein LOC563780 isoform X4 [Danio rerio]|eukprot:XP_005172921.2 uncharacterized protein LOC563780 isoform X4 [Danio rerio]